MLVNINALNTMAKEKKYKDILTDTPISVLFDLKDRNFNILRNVIYGDYYKDNYFLVLQLIKKTYLYSEYGSIIAFVRHGLLNDKITYTTPAHNMLLQDILDVVYTGKDIVFDKYRFLIYPEVLTSNLDPKTMTKNLELFLPNNVQFLENGLNEIQADIYKLVRNAKGIKNAFKIIEYIYHIPFLTTNIK